MPSDKRARQRAYRAEKQAEAAKAAHHRQNLRRSIYAALVVAVVVVVAVLSAIGGGGKKAATSTSTSTSAPATSSTSTTSTMPVPPTTYATPTTQVLDTKAIVPVCPPMTGAKVREVLFTKAPPKCIPSSSVWDATFTTSIGKFTVQMNAATSYAGVNNFVFLALYKYYDGTFFHRVISGFVIQGGDPSGTGSGQVPGGTVTYPGYKFTGNYPPESCLKTPNQASCYHTGDFVYANSNSDAANQNASTDASQFFVVLPGGATQLNQEPTYTDFGKVISGLSVCEKVASYPVFTYDNLPDYPEVKIYITNIALKEIKA